jgi:hypothetical protein
VTAAALAALVLAGCSSDAAPEPAVPSTDDGGEPADGSADDGDGGEDGGPVRPAAAAGSVGEEGSACPLPVVFDLAEHWSPAAIDVEMEIQQGPVTMTCEIDAKPAGQIGFLRVWTGDPEPGEPRAVLEAFLAGEHDATQPEYHDLEAGGFPAAEAVYVQGGSSAEQRTHRALAVMVPDGAVLLHLGGLDDEEHREMLPAYELAKASLRAR